MTQSPDNPGGRPAAAPSPGDPSGTGPSLDDQRDRPADPSPAAQGTPPVSVPPPSTWHFPSEPVPPPAPAPGPQPNGPAPYGTSPHYGTPEPYGGLPSYGAPSAGGLRPRRHGTPYGSGQPAYQGWPPGQEANLAEWWRRLLARLIDFAVVGIVLLPLAIPMLSRPFGRLEHVANQYPGLSTPEAQSAFSNAEGKFFVAVGTLGLIAAVIWFFYDSLQHARWGQTLGKRVLSTRVVSAQDGSPIGAAAAARRAAVWALIPVVPVVGTFFAIINDLWLLWDRRRQCLHDKVASTIVVKNVRGTNPAQPPQNGWPPPR